MTKYQHLREGIEELKDAEDCLFAAANCFAKASWNTWSEWAGASANGVREARKFLERFLRDVS